MEVARPDYSKTTFGRGAGSVFRWVRASLLRTHPLLTKKSGGVRGIVELQVLLEIERKLGGKIRIQEFFDLIVGTRSALCDPMIDSQH